MPVSDWEIEQRRAMGLMCNEGCYDCSAQEECPWWTATVAERQEAVKRWKEEHDE